jgi:hypothetical protein
MHPWTIKNERDLRMQFKSRIAGGSSTPQKGNKNNIVVIGDSKQRFSL